MISWFRLGTIVAIAACFYLFLAFVDQSGYKRGKAKAEEECVATNAAASQDRSKQYDKVQKKTKRIADSDLDNVLADLGIMRPESHR